ncbi:MAG: hypothetical protein DCC65_05210 [Planctomycetota bacterium]|nr:MAG: hypothetical protein DCC65_05210 [Planctomycetota bacterium]
MSGPHGEHAQRQVVCLVTDETATDRIPSALRYLQIGLIDENIEVLLVAPRDERSDSVATGPTTLITYRRPAWPLETWSRHRITEIVVEKAQSLKPPTPLLVHSLSSSCAPLAAGIAAALEGQLIMTVWSPSDASLPQLQQSVDRAALLIAPSAAVARGIHGRLPVQRPVEVVPLGVPVASGAAAFRSDDRSPTLLFAGTINDDEGIESMLRAARIVMQKHPNLLVFLVGKGPGEIAVRHLATSLGIEDQVIFTGRLEYLRRALEAADIFCLPSAAEPFREEILHAMACGLAITAVEASPYDGLEHGRTALLYREGADDALADHLLTLLDGHEQGRQLAAGARAHAISQNSVARMVAGHTRIYRQLDRRERTFSIAAGGGGAEPSRVDGTAPPPY